MKDILLKTSERKKEILLSAGAGNLNGHSSGEKDISGFNETVQAVPTGMAGDNVNPEEKEVARTIKHLQRQISDVSPTDIGHSYRDQKRPQ